MVLNHGWLCSHEIFGEMRGIFHYHNKCETLLTLSGQGTGMPNIYNAWDDRSRCLSHLSTILNGRLCASWSKLAVWLQSLCHTSTCRKTGRPVEGCALLLKTFPRRTILTSTQIPLPHLAATEAGQCGPYSGELKHWEFYY